MSKPKLALIPSGYKSGKVYSILPNDATGDFDFTRQSIGTRVRKDGLIEEAKTVGSITNELLYSEDFTQSNWFNSNSTDSISTIVSPDGASLSTLLTSTASNGGLADFNEWSTAVKTASIYVKKNTSSTFKISNLSSPTNEIVFNLDSGTVQSVGGNFSGQIISLPNGWFRCVGTHQAVSSQTLGFVIPTSGQSVYIWGAMLSEGALSDYIKTEGSQVTKRVETFTDVPRLDWLNSNCPSLLLEPQRTNLFQRSEQFDNSYWTKARASVTANKIIAPNGELTADQFFDSTDTNSHLVYRSMSITNGVEYSFSCFMKKGTLSKGFLAFNSADAQTVVFDLENGIVESQGANIDSSKIENYGNDWYKCSFTHTSTATTFLYRVGTYNGGITYTGTGNDYIYIWGAQLEQASYPTSYIKTEASTVTRLKDTCTLLNQTLFTNYPFTVYAKAKVEAVGNTVFSLVDSTNSNTYLLFYFSSSTQVGVLRRTPSASDSDFYNFTYSIGDIVKVAVAFINETSYKLYINGNEIADVISGASITFQHDDICLGQLRIASDTGTRNSIDDFRVYDYTLTDIQLTELTK